MSSSPITNNQLSRTPTAASKDVQQALSAKSLPTGLRLLHTNDSPDINDDAAEKRRRRKSMKIPQEREGDDAVVARKKRLQLAYSPLCGPPPHPEILQEIFLKLEGRFDLFDVEDTHYVVGQVCHEWRVVSHSFPRMWSRFVIIASNAPPQVRTLLKPAGNVPLGFAILKWTVECSEMFTSLLALLMAHSLNWGHAERGTLSFGHSWTRSPASFPLP
ncbi:hypothetical protein BDZ89DRAFT_474695 [Hymenopellis radicata]|nr:hypothetical protein BDZ89DRAFT_474695 [Hymenopellis radicata]